jgi:hypothetical protein
MYKFISMIIFSALLIGCQSDTPPEQTADQPMQDPFQQEQQMADIDVSDEELERFIDVTIGLQEGQMEAQQDMITIVEDEGLTVDSYNEIAQGMQMGQTQEELEVSDEDMEKYETITDLIADIERELDADMEEIINESGMSMDRFQQINMALQQDQELLERAQEMMQAAMMQQEAPGAEQQFLIYDFCETTQIV